MVCFGSEADSPVQLAVTLLWNIIWIVYLIRKAEPISNALACLLHFLFSIAFVIIGPYTSAMVAGAFQKATPNTLPQRHAIIALVGCALVNAVGLFHIILFLWCCNDAVFGTKPRANVPAQKDEEKRKSQINQLRISNPISVVKNPVPASASDQALFDAKAVITGETPLFAQSEGSRSSSSLSIFEDQPKVPQITVREIKVNTADNKPINSSPLSSRARSASGRASLLSTSLEFQQQYPQLSHDFKSPSRSQSPAPALQESPVRNSPARHSNTRLSLGLNSGRNSRIADLDTPEAPARTSQPHFQPARPSIPTTTKSSSNISSTPLRPSSLRTSISTTHLPPPAPVSEMSNTSASRSPKLIIPPTTSQPNEPKESPTSPSLTAPQPYNPRNSACAPEVVPSSPPPSNVPQPQLTDPIYSSSTPNLRSSKIFNPDGSISQSFTLNQAFPNLGRPASYRGVEQGSWRPGSSGGVSPQMLRMSNARRLDESSSEQVDAQSPSVPWIPSVPSAGQR